MQDIWLRGCRDLSSGARHAASLAPASLAPSYGMTLDGEVYEIYDLTPRRWLRRFDENSARDFVKHCFKVLWWTFALMYIVRPIYPDLYVFRGLGPTPPLFNWSSAPPAPAPPPVSR